MSTTSKTNSDTASSKSDLPSFFSSLFFLFFLLFLLFSFPLLVLFSSIFSVSSCHVSSVSPFF